MTDPQALTVVMEIRQLVADANDCLLGHPGAGVAMEYLRKAICRSSLLVHHFEQKQGFPLDGEAHHV